VSLPWVRLDSNIATNHKMLSLLAQKRHRAGLAYLFGLAYSGGHELDGYIPEAALPFLHATSSDASALVEVGMWEIAPGGWMVNSWNEFQVSNDENKKRRERAQKAAQKRWGGETK
jgi:hypothetical protein